MDHNVINGRRHEGICALILNTRDVCTCRAPFPIVWTEEDTVPNENALPNNDSTLAAVASAAGDLAARASVEYPGHVRLTVLNGRVAHVGTANGPWAFDAFEPNKEIAGISSGSFVVPESHSRTAEGIARYVVGTLAGIYEYRAYASERERIKADKAERKARNGRR